VTGHHGRQALDARLLAVANNTDEEDEKHEAAGTGGYA